MTDHQYNNHNRGGATITAMNSITVPEVKREMDGINIPLTTNPSMATISTVPVVANTNTSPQVKAKVKGQQGQHSG